MYGNVYENLSDHDRSVLGMALLTRRDWLIGHYECDPDPHWQDEYFAVMEVYYKVNPSAIGRVM